MKSSTKGGEIKIKQVRELGDTLSILAGRNPDVIDLPLSHLDNLSRAKAYAEKYGEVLEANPSNNRTIIVAPFGVYASIEELRLAYLQNPAMQNFVNNRYVRKAEFN